MEMPKDSPRPHTGLVIRQTLVALCFMPIIPDAIPSDQEVLTRVGKNAAPHTSLSPQKLQPFYSKGAQFNTKIYSLKKQRRELWFHYKLKKAIQPCFDPFNAVPTECPVTPAVAVTVLYLFQVYLHKNEEHTT